MSVSVQMSVSPGSRLVIDWHNYGFSIMALSHSSSSLIVKLARWYEGIVGRLANDHLCVTKAMQVRGTELAPFAN